MVQRVEGAFSPFMGQSGLWEEILLETHLLPISTFQQKMSLWWSWDWIQDVALPSVCLSHGGRLPQGGEGLCLMGAVTLGAEMGSALHRPRRRLACKAASLRQND